LISLIGIFTFAINENMLKRLLLIMVSFSAGTLMAAAFFHLLPEAVEKNPTVEPFLYVVAGFVLFFLLERILRWRHCHEGECEVHPFAYMNLVGDSLHNFIDGLAIAAGYAASIPLGITMTIGIATHEIPQEIGDFAVLLHGGFTKMRALTMNFLTAVTAILGGLVGYFLSANSIVFGNLLLPFAAGGFIYIAASDLIPELHKETNLKRSMLAFIVFVVGIVLIWALRSLEV
jgi:zinc and cadmium transporter